jgi:hypothetical protein
MGVANTKEGTRLPGRAIANDLHRRQPSRPWTALTTAALIVGFVLAFATGRALRKTRREGDRMT